MYFINNKVFILANNILYMFAYCEYYILKLEVIKASKIKHKNMM